LAARRSRAERPDFNKDLLDAPGRGHLDTPGRGHLDTPGRGHLDTPGRGHLEALDVGVVAASLIDASTTRRYPDELTPLFDYGKTGQQLAAFGHPTLATAFAKTHAFQPKLQLASISQKQKANAARRGPSPARKRDISWKTEK
jgi:hypothetical protein